jgi:hypothetical protein
MIFPLVQNLFANFLDPFIGQRFALRNGREAHFRFGFDLLIEERRGRDA